MKVSIIIPVYNVEAYIVECLQSVAAQTITEGVECLLVDDCGKDNSMVLAEAFMQGYEGSVAFHVLHHDHNRGLSAARNTGIDAAKGEYLFFLDSDDTITPRCIEQLLSLAKAHDADLVQGSYLSDYPGLERYAAIPHPTFSDDASYIKRTLLNYDINPVMAQNRLVRRQLLTDNSLYFREGIIHEDNHWTFFLAKHVRRMAFCKERTYFYRCTPGSIVNAPNREKEIKSNHVRLHDFIEGIDPIERGAQLRTIFCLLLQAIDCRYYASEEERKQLLDSFRQQNNTLQSWLISLIYHLKPGTWFRSKCINLLFRTYKA